MIWVRLLRYWVGVKAVDSGYVAVVNGGDGVRCADACDCSPVVVRIGGKLCCIVSVITWRCYGCVSTLDIKGSTK